MKTLSRTYLPESITLTNGKTFYLDLDKTNAKDAGVSFDAKNCVQVNVLSKNLRGRTDCHGLPYKPNVFIFSRYD